MVRWESILFINTCSHLINQFQPPLLLLCHHLKSIPSRRALGWKCFCPLIDQGWSGDLDSGLWLSQSDQLIWILASDWPRVIRWPGYLSLIGCWMCWWLGRTYFSDQFSSPVAKYFSPRRRVAESLSGFLRGNNLDLFVTTKLRNVSALRRGQCLSSVRDSLFGKWMLRINQRNKKLYHASNSVASHPRILMALENNLLFQKD